jgi:predicted TIM-barrel fold metal-dependent hydrolase
MVDVHHHILPPDYVRLVGRAAIGRPAPAGAPEWDVAASLRFLDHRGVRTAMVSISAPGIWFGDIPLAQKLARSSNEFAAQMVADHPGRFGSLAALPLPDVQSSLAELAHAADVLKCDGIGLITNYGDTYLGDSSFDPVLAAIDRRRLPVYVHPDACGCDQDLLPGVPLSMIEFPHSTTRAIVNMLSRGTFSRFPNIPFIFSHAGGTVPFLANRIARQGRMLGQSDWTDHLKRLYYDTASSANSAAFGPLLQLVSAQQVVLGTDFPFASAEAAGATVVDLGRLGLSERDLKNIQSGNARRLFPRLSS